MILLDTNIFLELLLNQGRADECQSLLSKLSGGDIDGVVTRFTLHSIESVYNDENLATFLSDVDRSLGLYVRETTTAEESEVASLAKKIGRDFDDALQYYVAKRSGAEAIVSFDKDFDGLDIPRVEPGNVLQG